MEIFIYHIMIIILGFWLSRKFFPGNRNIIFIGTISLTFGLFVSLPLTYMLAVLFQESHDPIQLGVVVFSGCLLGLLWLKRKQIVRAKFAVSLEQEKHKFMLDNLIDLFVAVFSLIFSSYIMFKTFKVASDGTFQIARNTVFDFGHSLSIIRSLSWGDNIPYSSPFVAGTEHIYHFMFHFWTAILEHSGIPIHIAVNIPGIIGFTLFLLTVYFIGKDLFGKTVIGALAILFTALHGGLMFIPFLQKNGISLQAILRNPNYFFTGPFDGSMYSLFFTLNVFVNQRQLGISLAIFFLIYVLFVKNLEQKQITLQRIFLYAVLIGLFTLWHLVLAAGLLFALVLYLWFRKKWRESFVLVSNALFVSLLFVHQWLPYLARALVGIFSGGKNGIEGNDANPVWFIQFILLNFGITLIFFFIGVYRKRTQVYEFLPLFILIGVFTILSIPAGIIDQKYLNVLAVLVALFSAAGVHGALKTKNTFAKMITILLVPFMILSGIIDFMVIKNDFMFSVEQTQNEGIVFFIKQNTEKDAIFLSYQEIFDPVTLAGRKNYYGFYKQPDIFLDEFDRYRGDKVRNVFDAQDAESLRYAVQDTGVDYIMIPPSDKADFPYTVNIDLLKKTFPVVMEDFGHILLDTRRIEY